MEETDVPIVYQSRAPHDPTRIGAAAVYCSDGRLGEAFDEFLQDCLGLPRYDRLAVPGGPACLAGHFDAWREGEAAMSQLKFLIEVHRLKRVVLMAHDACAFYTDRLKISPLGLVSRQREDLVKAAAEIRKLRRDLVVESYFAHHARGVVSFEPVED